MIYKHQSSSFKTMLNMRKFLRFEDENWNFEKMKILHGNIGVKGLCTKSLLILSTRSDPKLCTILNNLVKDKYRYRFKYIFRYQCRSNSLVSVFFNRYQVAYKIINF